ncbi:hypothetical protein KKF86_06880 [bacterium]|nr:hypothetical protein [bacterium]
MKYTISIILLGVGIASLISGIFFPSFTDEIFLGMVAPLVISVFSIQLVKRIHANTPEKLTGTLTKSFLFKMVLFALYFIIILSFYAFEPAPFVISFTSFFILFYIIEAIFLQKLIQTEK